jgi:hypothetical protein
LSLSARVPESLLEELEARFPDQCPSKEDTDREVWIKVGQVEVIRFLRKQFAIQNRNLMRPETDNPEEDD